MSDGLVDKMRQLLDQFNNPKQQLNEDESPACDEDGQKTRIEVQLKGEDDVEVEIYAKGDQEMHRLLDLAGVFHKERLANMGMSPQTEPEMGLPEPEAPAMGSELPVAIDANPVSEPMAADNMDDMDSGMDDMGGELTIQPDASIEMPDIDQKHLGEDEKPYASGKKSDYGYPNPNLGQEEYELDAYNFSGHGAKETRPVPARSGDNAMEDPADIRADVKEKKGLKEYMDDVEREITELADPQMAVTKAMAASKRPLTPAEKQQLKVAGDKVANEPGSRNLDDEQALDMAIEKSGLSDARAKELKKDYEDEAGIEERRDSHRYSFKSRIMPFQGLTGTQRISRNALKTIKRKR